MLWQIRPRAMRNGSALEFVFGLRGTKWAIASHLSFVLAKVSGKSRQKTEAVGIPKREAWLSQLVLVLLSLCSQPLQVTGEWDETSACFHEVFQNPECQTNLL